MENTIEGINAPAIDLSGLNDPQREAVVNTEGPMLVIAGAGSGKTRVLTTRIAMLIARGVPAERILALTFTKKAADEMRSRVETLAGPEARKVVMGTFHSVFIRFLRPFAQRIGFRENFTILDEDDSIACVKRCADAVLGRKRPPEKEWTPEQKKQFAEQDKNYKAKTMREIISSWKNELVTADEYDLGVTYNHDVKMNKRIGDAKAYDERVRPLFPKIFLEYRNACVRGDMMDFDDILLYTHLLLRNNPDVKAMIAGAFDYILVDEYQDTNVAQYTILKTLTWLNKNICVVGDDSQSIYAFRGARIENILNFEKEYPGCRKVILKQNYRSTSTIVQAANNLIAKNEGRIRKECFSDKEKGAPITIHGEDSEKGEAAYIADMIRKSHDADGVPYRDHAVLFRTNSQSRALEDAMVRLRIPYVIYSGTTFFNRMEVKDMMCYFRLAVNPDDDEAFRRVANKPVRGFGDAAMKRLSDVAAAWNMSLWATACNPSILLCGFGNKALEGLRSFLELIEKARKAASERKAYDAATVITDLAGIYEEYMNVGDEDSLTRADNIRELTDSVKAYEEDVESRNKDIRQETKEEPTLLNYLQNMMLLSNADTETGQKDCVQMMTVHCAKGLEFKTVFVAGMEKNLFPLEIDKTPFEREEERRLFYVAMTRAKENLYLTLAKSRIKFGQRKQNGPSPFLSELRKP